MTISARKAMALILACLAFVPSGQASNGLNDLLGIQLWGSGSLWEDVASDTATRLRLFDHENQSQNQNQNGGHFRANLEKTANLKMMGARVYSIEIYSTNQKVSRVVIGFVNRADLESELEAGVDKRKTAYNQFMVDFESKLVHERESAFAKISEQMTVKLGASLEGTASNLRKWDWQNHVLILENAELALTLRIEPEPAGQGAPALTSDQRKTQKLRMRGNGDVVVAGIPPISQGPRGFCVPASWEKCLRYNGLNLDVYELGEKGGTDFNGSAFIPFAAKIAPLLESRHFKMQLLKPNGLGIAMVKTYIDQAVPLIWCLNAQRMYYWVDRSRKRASYLNNDAEGLVKDPREMYTAPGKHALLIIGYNASLKEIALSDSTELGSGEPEIWIKEEDLAATAMPDGLVAVMAEDNKLVRETKYMFPSLVEKQPASTGGAQGKKWY